MNAVQFWLLRDAIQAGMVERGMRYASGEVGSVARVLRALDEAFEEAARARALMRCEHCKGITRTEPVCVVCRTGRAMSLALAEATRRDSTYPLFTVWHGLVCTFDAEGQVDRTRTFLDGLEGAQQFAEHLDWLAGNRNDSETSLRRWLMRGDAVHSAAIAEATPYLPEILEQARAEAAEAAAEYAEQCRD